MHCLISSLEAAAPLQLVLAATITSSLIAATLPKAALSVDRRVLPLLSTFGRKMTTEDWANWPSPLERGMETPIQYVPCDERPLMQGTMARVLKSRTEPWMRYL